MKEIISGKQMLERLLEGLDETANAITATMGPKGRNVFIGDSMMPYVTNDGATIANSISYPDKFKDLGSWVVRNSSSQTNDDAGDGTSTTALLVQEIIHKSLERPENAMIIKNSLQDACKDVVAKLKAVSKPIKIKDIKKVALISAENEEIAQIVTDVIKKVGEKGTILVEESKTFETSYEIQKGYEASVGFVSPYFSNDTTGTKAIYDDVLVLCSQKRISSVQDIKPLFDQLDAAKINQIVIVCEDIDPQILGIMAMSKQKGLLNILVIKANGSNLEDITASVGATLISDTTGITFDKLDIRQHLGHADKIVCSEKKTLFVAKTKQGQELANRLKEQAKICNNFFEQEMLNKRVAKLTGGIAVIKIGAATDLDRVYRKHKADDTVAAVKAALAEGIVEGGGMALWRIAHDMDAKTVGEEILKKSLSAPLRKICENSGKEYAEIVNKMPAGTGYDAKNDIYVEMIANDIVDPLKVERVALENAISNAAIFITSHCAICDAKENK